MPIRSYKVEDMVNTYENIEDIFEPTQIMAASNFPVSRLSYSYQDYWEMTLEAIQKSDLDFTQVAYQNAKRTYRF
jgi:predicted TIM-barrel fold metal-dependent hydrolase